jgi:very-short-patch-repair endonuclease
MTFHSEVPAIERALLVLRHWRLDERCQVGFSRFFALERERALRARSSEPTGLCRRRFLDCDYPEWLEELAKDAESSIEVLMGAYLLLVEDGYADLYYERGLAYFSDFDGYLGSVFTNQAERMGYRVDFLICSFFGSRRQELVVECDGHEFHANKLAAARDRERDRRLLALAGIQTIRFTGSEVYKEPLRCARQVAFTLRQTLNRLGELNSGSRCTIGKRCTS